MASLATYSRNNFAELLIWRFLVHCSFSTLTIVRLASISSFFCESTQLVLDSSHCMAKQAP